ncbi:MAG: hypothetical protein MI919_14240 [Holophagales bacterium]|nr:hypothetical protein [Holophagales bacterium]
MLVRSENPTLHTASDPVPRIPVLLATALLVVVGASAVVAQPTVSIGYQGPTAVAVNPGGAYRATPAPGPAPLPVVIFGPAALGVAPGNFGVTELDALSWGRDSQLRPNSAFTSWYRTYRMLISTDEFANGDPALAGPPDLWSEGTIGNAEASADLQITNLVPGQPLPPVGLGPFFGHDSWLDGNGFAPFGGLGIGLVEPNPPTPFALPDPGDTVDAADFLGAGPRLYFSLDARFTDPLEGMFSNAGTAAANGVRPGDVLVSGGGGTFGVWAQAVQLGLGSLDDLDALILHENGDGVFTASAFPFDWIFGATDMLLFSVRRGSPLIGTPDAFFGLPIEEGDVLTTPPGGPGTAPGIFIAAEALGLGTVRSGTNFLFPHGDDLDVLSVR